MCVPTAPGVVCVCVCVCTEFFPEVEWKSQLFSFTLLTLYCLKMANETY